MRGDRIGSRGAVWVILWALGIGSAVAAGAAKEQRIDGSVERVIDGDSLMLRPAQGDGPPLEVRLQGIDAPEGCQAGGPAAREMLASFVTGKTVTAVTRAQDHYGRTLATIEVDGVNVNQRMVAEGQAWSLRTKWDRGPYVAQERLAQSLRRGLHAQGGAEKPADFRRRHGPCAGAAGDTSTAARAPPTGASPRPTTAAAPPGTTAAAFRCDGRTHCSQMTSCEEATFFLQHCPGVKMDGNRDGVPCERQWCRR